MIAIRWKILLLLFPGTFFSNILEFSCSPTFTDLKKKKIDGPYDEFPQCLFPQDLSESKKPGWLKATRLTQSLCQGSWISFKIIIPPISSLKNNGREISFPPHWRRTKHKGNAQLSTRSTYLLIKLWKLRSSRRTPKYFSIFLASFGNNYTPYRYKLN